MDKTIKAAIVGFGGMAQFHLTMMTELDGIECAGIYDIADEPTKKAKEKGIKTFDSFDELINTKEIDLVVIATPNDVHHDIAISAMNKGKNVISEKPVAMNSKELQEMIDCAKKNNVLFSVHQNRRWDGDYRAVRKAVEEGTLGNVYRIESRIMGSRGIPGDWRAKKKHGGGMVLDWGVHIIDQMLDMFSPLKVAQVYVKMQHTRYDEVDDGFVMELTFENGMNVMLETSTCTYINLPRWYVCGDKGTMIIEDWELNGKILRPKTDEDLGPVKPIKAGAGLTKTMAPRDANVMEELPIPRVHVKWDEYYENYIATLNGKAELIVKPEQAMRVMKVMEAMFLSEKEKRSVDVSI